MLGGVVSDAALRRGWRWRMGGTDLGSAPRSGRRFGIVSIVSAVLFGLLGADLARAPEAASAATPAVVAGGGGSGELLPVWAFVNGTAPVANARVGVVTARGPLPQAGGRKWKRTNREGVALLEFDRLPRRFTVVVRGGRAHGMRVPGSQRREVRRRAGGHRPVEVNPLTTLLARLERGRPDLGERRARRAVKRYFGVPRWADLGESLRLLGDEWFHAGAYLRAARKAGSIDRLNRELARSIIAGEDRRVAPVRGRAAATASGIGEWLQLPARELARRVFQGLSGLVGEIGAGAAINSLLRLAGAGQASNADIDLVREQLDAIGRQIERLSGQIQNVQRSVERGRASELLHRSDEVLAAIDHARTQLAYLANLDPGREPELRAKFAKTIDGYIGARLLDAAAILNKHLNPSLGIGDNAIKATSRALAADRFFDRRDSAEVDSVYDYFATYQTQLGVLLANYWDAHADTYSRAIQEAELDRIKTNVLTAQQESLKTPVPAGAFFDTRTPAFMWGTENLTVDAFRAWKERFARNLRLGEFKNWQMPSSHDLDKLLDGATSPARAWLQSRVQVPLRHQLYWTSDLLQLPFGSVRVRIFDLQTGKLEYHEYQGESSLLCPGKAPSACPPERPIVTRFLETKRGGLMLLRYTAPGESYWW